jgi:hypothetical protein
VKATIRTTELPAVAFSNEFAGFRQVDPVVAPGQAISNHMHAWLGNRLDQHANTDRLFDEPRDWETGSNAARRGTGFSAETTYQGRRDGYTPGVWWPAIWDAPPGKAPRRVSYNGGISTYYLAMDAHGKDYLTAPPNGLVFIVDGANYSWTSRSKGTFKVNFFGPRFWDGQRLDSGDHRSHVSRTRSATHPVAIPEFQTYIKATLAYPSDNTPLEDRLRFGDPNSWVPPHMDYVAGYRQDWFLQWLLDLGPNWGHPDNPLRDCGVSMPGSLQRRKLEGVRMASSIGSGGSNGCGASAPPASPTPPPTTDPPDTEGTGDVVAPQTPTTSPPAATTCGPLEPVSFGVRTATIDIPPVDGATRYRGVVEVFSTKERIARVTVNDGTRFTLTGLPPDELMQVRMRAYSGAIRLCRHPRLMLATQRNGKVFPAP